MFSRTKTTNQYSQFLFTCFISIFLILSFAKTDLNSFIAAYTPLFIGFLYFALQKFKTRKNEVETLSSIVIFLEMTLVYMRTGRSFADSISNAQQKSFNSKDLYFLIKKNVVMQQPKSRNGKNFDQLNKNLQSVADLKVGKMDLLSFLKQKFETQLLLKQKIKVSTTQYRAQTAVLFLFWCLCLASLTYQKTAITHLNVIIVSFTLMVLGHLLSKAILLKETFRI